MRRSRRNQCMLTLFFSCQLGSFSIFTSKVWAQYSNRYRRNFSQFSHITLKINMFLKFHGSTWKFPPDLFSCAILSQHRAIKWSLVVTRPLHLLISVYSRYVHQQRQRFNLLACAIELVHEIKSDESLFRRLVSDYCFFLQCIESTNLCTHLSLIF